MTASPPVRTLQEMLDTSRLAELIEGGYIRVKEHPREPLRLYDYGPKVQIASRPLDGSR